MADLDDQPAKLSELDLSEDAAITGEDVEDAFVGEHGDSAVSADPAADAPSDEVADAEEQ